MSLVPLYLDILGAALDRYPAGLKRLGDLETKLLSFDTENLHVKEPIFVTGVARAGTTILLEILASHPQLASHHYRDFPFIHADFFWNRLQQWMPIPPSVRKVERAHKDRIMVNRDSPEGMEEILWMSFFDNLHDPARSGILDAGASNPEFEAFFDSHIRKILLLRKALRYVSKNNYNVTRIAYLKKLYPDARFIIPVRRPAAHVWSLLKQHRMIVAEQQKDPRAARYMRRHGHFEFGIDFRPINTGRDTAPIMDAWRKGDTIIAFALYWRDLHDYLWQEVHKNESVRQSCLFVRYDDLCAQAEDRLQDIFSFIHIDGAPVVPKWKNKLSEPDYYTAGFTEAEKQAVADITASTEKLFWPQG